MDIHTFITELRSTLKEDPFLQDGCFDGVPVLSVSGIENSETWKIGIRAEADRLGVKLLVLDANNSSISSSRVTRWWSISRPASSSIFWAVTPDRSASCKTTLRNAHEGDWFTHQ